MASTERSPVLEHPPEPPVLCPRCGKLFEAPFEAEGVRVAGHQTGDPRVCIEVESLTGKDRDAKVRKSRRRGR